MSTLRFSILRAHIRAATEHGGWAPAPDNTVVYDFALPWTARAEVMIRDLPPSECTVPRLARITDECGLDLTSQQHLVRFGRSTFVNPQPDGTALPRPAFDDPLSTYIEEVSHSWRSTFRDRVRQWVTRAPDELGRRRVLVARMGVSGQDVHPIT